MKSFLSVRVSSEGHIMPCCCTAVARLPTSACASRQAPCAPCWTAFIIICPAASRSFRWHPHHLLWRKQYPLCYMDIKIAQSIEMASVRLPFSATFHWHRSLGVTHLGNSRMTLGLGFEQVGSCKKVVFRPGNFRRAGTSGELTFHLEL